MKRSPRATWWPNPEEPCALHLAPTFAAEHECGIAPLRRAFGLPELSAEHVGLERHRIRVIPPALHWMHRPRSRYAYLRYDAYAWREPTVHGPETWIGHTEETAGAWSMAAFYVVAKTPGARRNLQALRDAFAALDVAILLGGRNGPLSGPGLTLAIISRTPPEVDAALREHDLAVLARLDATVGDLVRRMQTEENEAAAARAFARRPRVRLRPKPADDPPAEG